MRGIKYWAFAVIGAIGGFYTVYGLFNNFYTAIGISLLALCAMWFSVGGAIDSADGELTKAREKNNELINQLHERNSRIEDLRIAAATKKLENRR